jgi:quercetin dioxygenase-like cupin family protein
MLRRSILVSLVGLAASAAYRFPHRQDRAKVVPDMKVLLENEHVRVQYHDVKVGETTPIHSHPAYVAFVFNSFSGKALLADGSEKDLSRKAADVFYSGPVTHRIVNTGDTPIHNLIVELKGQTKIA